MKPVIKVEDLGKRYIIGSQNQNNAVFRDVLSNVFSFSKTKDQRNSSEFWAINDVSFSINQGEQVGIIGHNGSGKSTLLKLLSRITEPTRGKITLRGRVASLLEVGTGFHPDLTGRENIFLNGAILGMRKNEIIKKFDEIVAFSEVEQFLDTPVKRYSSGMYVRLAFSVAAHLEPEVLIVDEVLAVGDASFQKKCLGKMDSVGKEGRTVLFVSHNMAAIRQLCPRTILLSKGRIIIDEKTDITLQKYNQVTTSINIDEFTAVNNLTLRRGDGGMRFSSIELMNSANELTTKFKVGEKVYFKLVYKVFKPILGVKITIAIRSSLTDSFVTTFEHKIHSKKMDPGEKGEVVLEMSSDTLRPGDYPLYFQIIDEGGRTTNEDIVDGITPPLVIQNESIITLNDYNILSSVGVCSIPTRIVKNEFL